MIHSVSNMHLYEWNIQECNVNLCCKILLVWKVSLATKDLRTNDVEFGGEGSILTERFSNVNHRGVH